METIPKTSVPLIKADLPAYKDVEEHFKEILSNGKITNFGKYVQQLEKDASTYLGTEVLLFHPEQLD